MKSNSEKRGFYRGINRAISLLEQAGFVRSCGGCNGEGMVKDEPCEECAGWGDKSVSILRRMRHEDDYGALSDTCRNMVENFCPSDLGTAWKLSVATQVLHDSDAEAVVAWMFANLSVIIKANPHLTESDLIHKWSQIFTETIEAEIEGTESTREVFKFGTTGEA